MIMTFTMIMITFFTGISVICDDNHDNHGDYGYHQKYGDHHDNDQVVPLPNDHDHDDNQHVDDPLPLPDDDDNHQVLPLPDEHDDHPVLPLAGLPGHSALFIHHTKQFPPGGES